MHPADSATSNGKISQGSPCDSSGGARSDIGENAHSHNENSDCMDSLGAALAGMQMGGPSGATAATTNYGSAAVSVSTASSPFAIARDNDWGNFAEAAHAAFPSTGVSAANHHHQMDASNNDTMTRTQAFDLFPSPNATKTLPSDVFRFSHSNLSGIEEKSSQSDPSAYRYPHQSLAPGAAPGSFGEMMRPTQEPRQRRTESPSCSVTGTTTSSRSVSPYTNSSNDVGSGSSSARVIQAYQRFDSSTVPTNNSSEALARNPSSFAEDDRSTSGYSLSHTHSHPSLATLDSAHRSPYSKEWSTHRRSSGSPYDQALDRSFGVIQTEVSSSPQINSATTAATSSGQPQVLYMAVPSPDGRGQVLQPVQMVQLSGKPNYFVGSIHNNVGSATQADGSSHHNMGIALPACNGEQVRTVPVESRSRVANYAIESSANRSFGNEPSALSASDEFGRSIVAAPPNVAVATITATGNSAVSTASGQYQVDSAVAQLYAAPQRPPLEALLGQVRRLSRDQVGCRLVQQALDEEGPLAATLILNEGLPFWGEAMVDPFGNYLFQKILEKITPEERVLLVKTVSPRLVNSSLNLHGTRSVQKVVELCAQDEQNRRSDGVEETAADILTAALAPAAARLCIDSHGNHVIQRILLKLGPKHTRFVFDAVAASVGDVARHRHGCCVIQRCLDSPQNEARDHLVRRIVDKSLELMQDAYGNYVVQYVLDVCSDEDVAAVCESVVGRVNLLSIQKFSSNVMEKCLERCSERVKEHYLAEMSDPERIRELMMDPFGNYVVQRALSVATHAQAIRLVEAMRPHLLSAQSSGPHGQRSGGVRNTAGGRRIIAKICRRFPNFTLSTIVPNDELYSSNRIAHRHQTPVLAAAYAPIGAATTLTHAQHFAADPFAADPFLADPRLTQAHAIPQTYYTLGGTPYYEPQYSGGHGGFPGM